jgi:hypothetical protein
MQKARSLFCVLALLGACRAGEAEKAAADMTQVFLWDTPFLLKIPDGWGITRDDGRNRATCVFPKGAALSQAAASIHFQSVSIKGLRVGDGPCRECTRKEKLKTRSDDEVLLHHGGRCARADIMQEDDFLMMSMRCRDEPSCTRAREAFRELVRSYSRLEWPEGTRSFGRANLPRPIQ